MSRRHRRPVEVTARRRWHDSRRSMPAVGESAFTRPAGTAATGSCRAFSSRAHSGTSSSRGPLGRSARSGTGGSCITLAGHYRLPELAGRIGASGSRQVAGSSTAWPKHRWPIFADSSCLTASMTKTAPATVGRRTCRRRPELVMVQGFIPRMDALLAAVDALRREHRKARSQGLSDMCAGTEAASVCSPLCKREPLRRGYNRDR